MMLQPGCDEVKHLGGYRLFYVLVLGGLSRLAVLKQVVDAFDGMDVLLAREAAAESSEVLLARHLTVVSAAQCQHRTGDVA